MDIATSIRATEDAIANEEREVRAILKEAERQNIEVGGEPGAFTYMGQTVVHNDTRWVKCHNGMHSFWMGANQEYADNLAEIIND